MWQNDFIAINQVGGKTTVHSTQYHRKSMIRWFRESNAKEREHSPLAKTAMSMIDMEQVFLITQSIENIHLQLQTDSRGS